MGSNLNLCSTYSLAPVQGVLNEGQILHFLRRTLFGINQGDLKFFEGKTVTECLDVILTHDSSRPLPVQEKSDYVDPTVNTGEVWVNAPYVDDFIQSRRDLLLKIWWLGNIVNRSYSLTEKMTLFWHNHFVTEMMMVKDARYSYRYLEMLRRQALGNFKELIREGSSNIAMLVYLSGNYNTKEAPNENYARELLELFTIGKEGGQKYTEQDVREAARVLTGYVDNKDDIKTHFIPERHDAGDKQFSAFFGNRIIKGRSGQGGTKELDELVDMIFNKTETAHFCCRNLYRWFVSHRIDEEVESQIISPLSELLVEQNFEIKPVLKTLLGSEHFFDAAFRGCIVKNPVEYFVGAFHQFDVVKNRRLDLDHESWLEFCFSTAELGMEIGNPPSVAGWPAYYQAPKFHRWWANSASLSLRKRKMYILSTQEGMVFNGSNLRFDYRLFLGQIQFNSIDDLINRCLVLLLATEVGEEEKKGLKEALLMDKSEGQWIGLWRNYLSAKDDPGAVELAENSLRPFFKKIIAMAEYHMM